ncbi:MAG: iron-containing redox enzyme family protein [Gammaproteobacteria bacterium]
MTFYTSLVEHTSQARDDFARLPAIQHALSGNITLEQYQTFLSNAYQHVKHTVPLLMACGAQLKPHQTWLQKPIAHYIEEEIGHERWILKDLETCNGDPEAVLKGEPDLEVDILVSYAYDVIHRKNPVGFFGMVFVLEGISAAMASDAAAAIARSLSLPKQAFTYLDSHGHLDQSHIAFFGDLMNRVTDVSDQRDILHCAKRFYRLYGQVLTASWEK